MPDSVAVADLTLETSYTMEPFQALLAKAHKHFNNLRDLPTFGSHAWEKSYHKAFKASVAGQCDA